MIENNKGKTVNPAVVEHMAMENEKLRGLLREVRVLLSNSSYKISGTAAFLSSIDAALSQQAEPANVMQYYYRANGCDAATSKSEDCICWHDQGTGPYPKAVLGDETFTGAALAWREKPEQPSSAPAQDERDQFAKVLEAHLREGTQPTFSGGDLKHLIRLVRARPAQTEQQPFGWVTEDYLTDKSATTYDQVVADRWRAKGWPVREIYTAPIAQTAPTVAAPGGDIFWREKLAIKFCEARGILDGSTERARVVDAFVSALSFAAPQPEQSGLVEALKRIQCLMADREAQALDGSQDRQLFVTILNIADAALSPSIPATYSCDYAGCSSKAHPGTSLCLAHHSPKNRDALSAQGASK